MAENNRILRDKTKTGKVRPWRERKVENLTYADYLEMLQYRKARRVKECGEVLRFVADDSGHLRLFQTWFCKSRLCPLCNWRRSMKESNQLIAILNEAVKEQPKGRFLFLTLTVRNTTGDRLKGQLRQMGRAIAKLMQYKKPAKNLLGYVRSTEITVQDVVNQPMYHHHMHVLLFVKSSYFRGLQNYISQSEWTQYWRKAMKLDYDPIVNLKAVHSNKVKGKSSLVVSAQETAKYQVKSTDVLTNNRERDLQVIDDLEHGLERSRMISFAGLLKKIRKQLNMDQSDENLIDTDGKRVDVSDKVRVIVAKWNYERSNYFING